MGKWKCEGRGMLGPRRSLRCLLLPTSRDLTDKEAGCVSSRDPNAGNRKGSERTKLVGAMEAERSAQGPGVPGKRSEFLRIQEWCGH